MSINDNILDWDRDHLWHPYTSMVSPLPCYCVTAAKGCYLELSDGRKVIDGMSSWWSAVHGYRNERLNNAAKKQLDNFSHVMFGGLTHAPAVALGKALVEITPDGLEHIFYSDSGSVAVEVAIKMAMQYQIATGNAGKNKLLTVRGGYHGDTFATMAVCDPDQGMHTMWGDKLSKAFFADKPATRFDDDWNSDDIVSLEKLFEDHHNEIAAFIIEPIVQGAGGMWLYHPQYLREARRLCDKYDVLLIADEIATGFGRTGKLWACNQAEITPDILCVGKALTGGMMSLAATITTAKVAQGISSNGGVLMHGPTFMGNPLACAIAVESLAMLSEFDLEKRIGNIQQILTAGLAPCREIPAVADVRVLGAIGVIEMKKTINVAATQEALIERGVWLRPFGKLLYAMPPYVISDEQLHTMTKAIKQVAALTETTER